MPPAGAIGVFGVDLRQRDERPAVVAASRRSAAARSMRRFMVEDRPGAHELAAACASAPARPHAIAPGRRPKAPGSIFSSTSCRTARACRETGSAARSIVPNRLLTIGNAAALDVRIQNRRPAGLIDAPLDLGRFQVRIDLRLDAHQPLRGFEICDASL